MKKLVIFCVVLTTLSVWDFTKASNEGVLLAELNKNSELFQHISVLHGKKLENIIVLPNKPFDYEEAAAIITRIGNLPLPILTKLYQSNITIQLFEGKLTDQPTAQHLKGVRPRGYESMTTWDDVPGIGGDETVLVKIGHSEKGKGHGSVNLELHELAHSIDKIAYPTVRYDSDFLKAWTKERDILFPNMNYFITYPEEFFAECFAMYYLNEHTNHKLKQKAPLTYEFIKNLH